ncbi:MAG: hypothetical protein MSH10_07360 [Pygmaiobacter massiliensis]|nr:hypothetical protein [Pygmaiobacter massiliensis]
MVFYGTVQKGLYTTVLLQLVFPEALENSAKTLIKIPQYEMLSIIRNFFAKTLAFYQKCAIIKGGEANGPKAQKNNQISRLFAVENGQFHNGRKSLIKK